MISRKRPVFASRCGAERSTECAAAEREGRSRRAATGRGRPSRRGGPPLAPVGREWSSEQAAALDQVGRWLRDGEPQVFRLFGYAGVGKTTLARHIAEGARGRGGVRRLHRQGGAGDALEGLRRRDDHPRADLPRERGRGRRAELHPQRRRPGLARRPDRDRRMLDGRRGTRRATSCRSASRSWSWAIPRNCRRSRAAASSPRPSPTSCSRTSIGRRRTIRSSACREIVRDGGELALRDLWRERASSRARQIDAAGCSAADQVLVGLNRTRRALQQRMRDLKGSREPLPVAGDRLVCLRNDRTKGLINGGLWRVEDARRHAQRTSCG